MNPIDVIMPTLGKNGDATANSLRHLPVSYRLLTDDGPGWSAGINRILFNRVQPQGDVVMDVDMMRRLSKDAGDVLIIDDDAELLPDTFKDCEEWYPKADIFGFRLLYTPEGPLQHGGGWVRWNGQVVEAGHLADVQEEAPTQVAYVTTSVCLIKAHVIAELGPLDVWPGRHWEDVSYCCRAWAAGFKVAYVPNAAIHRESQTVKLDPRLQVKFELNRLHFSLEREEEIRATADKFAFRNRRSL